MGARHPRQALQAGRDAPTPDPAATSSEPGLPAADQLQIDPRQELAVELRSMPAALGEVDLETAAEGVEAGRRAGKAPAGKLQGVDMRCGEGWPSGALQLGFEEFEIELGIVDDERVAADEGQELRR